MAKPVLIFGATLKGKIVADILQQNNVMVYGFLDDNTILQGKPYAYAIVVGTMHQPDLLNLLKEECYAFIALENQQKYQTLFQQLLQKHATLSLVNAIHPSVNLNSTHIGDGNCIQGGVQLEPEIIISSHCTIRNNVVIQCNSVLHNHVYIGANSTIGSNVIIEQNTTIEANVIIKDNITIGESSYIPAGAIIHDDVSPFTTLPAINNVYIR